jgi:hypothetical protein
MFLGRPAKKRCRAEAKATRLGQLQAEYQFKKAHSIAKKPEDFLEEQGKKLLDKLDPLETVAIVGMTVLVHGVIISSKPLVEKTVQAFTTPEGYLQGFLSAGLAWVIPPESVPWLGKKLVPEAKTLESLGVEEWQIWVISFTLAYIIIKHSGQLIGLMEKGLGSVVPMLLGVAV